MTLNPIREFSDTSIKGVNLSLHQTSTFIPFRDTAAAEVACTILPKWRHGMRRLQMARSTALPHCSMRHAAEAALRLHYPTHFFELRHIVNTRLWTSLQEVLQNGGANVIVIFISGNMGKFIFNTIYVIFAILLCWIETLGHLLTASMYEAWTNVQKWPSFPTVCEFWNQSFC